MTTLQTTAILKTDLTGSTPYFRSLSEADLQAALRDHRTLITRIAAQHDGRIVKPEGDGFWLTFPSVTAAGLAAMALQEEMRLAQPNKGDDRLRMRVVITLGDVHHQEGALVGDAVVLATRIEALTPPDEIYLSTAAWLAMNRAEVRTLFVQSFSLKGFVDPVAVYRVEQVHRTRVLTDQLIVVADLKGFTALMEASGATVMEKVLDGLQNLVEEACRAGGGVVRFGSGDGYCMTFSDAEATMAALADLVTTWDAFVRGLGVRCRLNIGLHKGMLYAFRSYLHSRDLNIAFAVESSTQRRDDTTSTIYLSGRVRDDLAGTAWEPRLEPVVFDAKPARLGDETVYILRGTR